MAEYYCKCGKRTTGRFAKANMVRHITSKHIEPQGEDESYNSFRKRYDEWID